MGQTLWEIDQYNQNGKNILLPRESNFYINHGQSIRSNYKYSSKYIF
jgi:hypothetical protein